MKIAKGVLHFMWYKESNNQAEWQAWVVRLFTLPHCLPYQSSALVTVLAMRKLVPQRYQRH